MKGKKILESIKKFLNESKKVIKDNKILLLFIVGSVFNGFLLRGCSVGQIYKISPLSVDLLITLLFASVYFLL